MLTFKNINILFAILLLVFVFLIVKNTMSFWYGISLLFIWLAITSIGSFHIRWNYFLKAKHCNYNIVNNEISLTFDDGPHPVYTEKALELLEKHHMKATFFCIGKNAEKYPNLVRKIIDNGHEIGNHSYKHSNDYGFLSTEKVIEDLIKTQNILKKSTKKKNVLFRPPFGVTNPNIAKAVKKLNLQTYGWSIRTYDTVAKSAHTVCKKVKNKIKKGDVILLHDTSALSISILEQLLQSFEQNKIKSVIISQLFNNKTHV